MEYQPARTEPHSFVQGVVSVLSANGAGIADAVRRSNGWIPAGIVAAGGLSTGFFGILSVLSIWMLFACICWISFMIASLPGTPRPTFSLAVKMCGWCMLPYSIAALLLTLPGLIYQQPLVQILVWTWIVIAPGAGWAALTGVTRVRSTVAAVLGVVLTALLQLVFWLGIFFILTFLTMLAS